MTTNTDCTFDAQLIYEASERIAPYIYKTPLEQSFYLSTDKRQVFLKLECQQLGKSFKIRGAMNKLLQLTEAERTKGVATVSSGNHGIAVAYGANRLGIQRVEIIVPETTPQSKIDKIKCYGGDVRLMGVNYDEAHQLGMAHIENSGLVFIDGGDLDEAIYAGQGTAALEVLKEQPDIDVIYVPIGGGAFAIGSAIAAKSVKPSIKVYGLYSEACPAWADSVSESKLYATYDSKPSVCEAMVGGISQRAFALRDILDGAYEVTEAMVKEALCHAVLNEKVVVEASGAVPIAAVLQYGESLPGKKIALMLSGGNVDSRLLKCTMDNHVL